MTRLIVLVLLVRSASANPEGCECTGVNTGINGATYGTDFGTACKAWEDGGNFTLAPSCDTFSAVGTWCCRPWCYIDPTTCDGLTTPYFPSYFADASIGDALYFSYAACDPPATAERTYADAASCPWQGPNVYMPDVRVQMSIFDKSEGMHDEFGCTYGGCQGY